MPRRWSEALIEKYEREGRGKGHGSAYQPWIRVQDFSSQGTSTRWWGVKTQRDHQFLSNIELNICAWLEYAPQVLDIREQYPLEREITLELAAAAGIPHPYYPRTKVHAVMTVDFLVTLQHRGERRLMAIDAKSDQAAEDPMKIGRLEITRRYFEAMDVPHHLVFGSKLPIRQINNIKMFRDAMLKPGDEEPYQGFYDGHQTRMLGELRRPRPGSLADYCNGYDTRHGLERGNGLRIAYMLMHTRALQPDLNTPDIPAAPLSSFIVTTQAGKLRAVS